MSHFRFMEFVFLFMYGQQIIYLSIYLSLIYLVREREREKGVALLKKKTHKP